MPDQPTPPANSPARPAPTDGHARNDAAQASQRTQGWMLAGITLAFAAMLLLPFGGGVCWAVFLAIVFIPMQRTLRARLGGHRNTAALLSLLAIVLMVMLPLALLATALAQQAGEVAASWRAGEIDLNAQFERVVQALPAWGQALLQRLGLDDLSGLQQRLMTLLGSAPGQLSGRVFLIGQYTLEWVLSFCLMLYLLFFLLRDGDRLAERVLRASPLAASHSQLLAQRFVGMVRATVKGNAVVALVQAGLGMAAFWTLGIPGTLLWGALMAAASLIPSVGCGLIWGPVAAYLLATGEVGEAIALVLWGTLVIGLADNLLRPMLVGRHTHVPDYVILAATLGGIAVFGINGFVIGPVIAALFLAAWEIAAPQAAHLGPRESPSLRARAPATAAPMPVDGAPPPFQLPVSASPPVATSAAALHRNPESSHAREPLAPQQRTATRLTPRSSNNAGHARNDESPIVLSIDHHTIG